MRVSLKESEFEAQMAEAAIASSVNAIIIVDDDGRIQRANPAAMELFGFSLDEMLDRNVHILMPEPYHSAHGTYMRNYMTSGEKKIIGIGREVTGRRKDGSVFPMHLAVGEFKANGRRYFVGTIHDISARVRAEAESVRQKTFFQAIFEHSPHAMIISDVHGDISLCNPAAIRTFGHSADALVGRALREIYISHADYEQMTERAKSSTHHHKREGQIILFARAGEVQFPGVAAFMRIVDPQGGSFGFLTVVRDVSQELAQQQALRKIQRMEALGQLTGGIAHDFNNLLTIITGNHELLEFELQDDDQRDLLKRANDAAMMGARLTNRLLTFARSRPLDAVLVNMNELLHGTMDLLRQTLGETIGLSPVLAPDLWPVRSDISEIENALLNLAINARDAMPQGGTLMLETRNLSFTDADDAEAAGLPPADYVCLSISDTGEGMNPEVLAKAFEPFFTTKEAGKGTGLGLSAIYGFAKQSGGDVTIESEIGLGTTVSLYLPRAHGDKGTVTETASSALDVRPGNGETILVVEDQEQVRDVTVRRLAKLGYAVVEADNAASAIELLQGDMAVDLVFSDIIMPGNKTGLDLAEWVRENRPSLPLVLSSGFASDLAQMSVHGAYREILRKPYSRDDLASAIRTALDQARS